MSDMQCHFNDPRKSNMAAMAAISIFFRKFVRTTPPKQKVTETWHGVFTISFGLPCFEPILILEIYDIQNGRYYVIRIKCFRP